MTMFWIETLFHSNLHNTIKLPHGPVYYGLQQNNKVHFYANFQFYHTVFYSFISIKCKNKKYGKKGIKLILLIEN